MHNADVKEKITVTTPFGGPFIHPPARVQKVGNKFVITSAVMGKDDIPLGLTTEEYIQWEDDKLTMTAWEHRSEWAHPRSTESHYRRGVQPRGYQPQRRTTTEDRRGISDSDPSTGLKIMENKVRSLTQKSDGYTT